MTIGNLRGVKESAKMFAIPTYIFIIAMLILIVTGLVKVYVFGEVPQSVYPVPEAVGDMTFFLMIRAFAAGCFGLTGVEAVPNYEVTVLSQIASQVFGNGIWFYILQISTAVILKIKGCHGFFMASFFGRHKTVLSACRYLSLHRIPDRKNIAAVFQGSGMEVIFKVLIEGGSIPKAAGVCDLRYGQMGFLEQLQGYFDAVLEQVFLRG